MRRRFVNGIAVILMLTVATPLTAHAQTVAKGTLSGSLFTAGATANASSVPLYTAPATAKDGIAIITAVCGYVSAVNQVITGSTLGNLAVSAGQTCFEFGLGGLPLPPGEVLTYGNTGSYDAPVRIVGILSKK